MLQEECYWRPAAVTPADKQPHVTGEPDGSLAPADPDLISSDGQPSFLPSPDSTHSPVCSARGQLLGKQMAIEIALGEEGDHTGAEADLTAQFVPGLTPHRCHTVSTDPCQVCDVSAAHPEV